MANNTAAPFTTISAKSLDHPAGKYPYLVVRIFSCAYQREAIAVRVGEPGVRIAHHDCHVQHPEPFAMDGSLSESCRAMLLEAVGHAVRNSGFRMCLVWALDACSYVERESVSDSVLAPSGGIALPAKIAFDQWAVKTQNGHDQPGVRPDDANTADASAEPRH